MSELRLNAIRLNTLSLNTMAINHIGFKKKASSSASGDVDENGYIIFADPEVARICAENWGDGTGITEAQAASVTDIGTKFYNNKDIEYFDELEVFVSLKALANSAFYGASALKSINLSNIVTLGRGCFKNTSLSIVVDIPNLTGVVPIGAFENTMIEGINDLGSITTIEGHPDASAGSAGYGNHCAFRNCKSLKYAKLPSTLTTIQYASFAGCTQLTSVEFEDNNSITSIAYGAFYEVPAEFVVDFPNLSGTLGYAAYQNSGVKKIVNLGGITVIDGNRDARGPYGSWGNWGAFKNCVSLESAVLPDTPYAINHHAFYGCSNLKSLHIGGATSIAAEAFRGCTSLEIEDLQLPNLETLGQNAFYGVKIKKMVLGKEGSSLTLPTGTSSTQNFGDKNVLEEVELYGVTNINPYSFYNYTILKKVLWNSSVTSINNQSFTSCSSLMEIGDMSSVISIGDEAFRYCKKLNIDIFLQNVTTIRIRAFENCGIKTIKLPNVTAIGNNCFANSIELEILDIGEYIESIGSSLCSGCTKLKALICRKSTPPSIDNNIIAKAPNAYIYVHDGSVEKYKTATNWIAYADRILPLSQYNE